MLFWALASASAVQTVLFGVEGGQQEMTVTAGVPLVVHLEGCRTCGYEWEAPDVTPARLVSKTFAPRLGKGGKGVFEFVLEYREPREAGVHFEYRRPWEKAAAATADLTVHARAALVLAGNRRGNDADAHGCKPSVGQAWCPATSACVMHGQHCPGGTEQCQKICTDLKAGKSPGYETNCECDAPLVLAGNRRGNDADAHGCKPSVGQAWCPATSACVMHGQRCPGGTEQCQKICTDLKAGKSPGYETNCECKQSVIV